MIRSLSIGYAAVPNAEMPETFGKDRLCEECGCTLSQYNPSDRCWMHDFHEDPEALLIRALER